MDNCRGRILFVDDDPDTGELVQTALKLARYEVVVVSEAAEALSQAESGKFHLILLDWILEDGTGLELCKSIRMFDENTPIFFYSGVAYPALIQEALRAGAQGYFVKPVDIEEFLRVIVFELGEPSDTMRHAPITNLTGIVL